MSKAGRLQDALHDYLWGYQHGMTGENYPGPLQQAGLSWDQANSVCKEIESIVWRIFAEERT